MGVGMEGAIAGPSGAASYWSRPPGHLGLGVLGDSGEGGDLSLAWLACGGRVQSGRDLHLVFLGVVVLCCAVSLGGAARCCHPTTRGPSRPLTPSEHKMAIHYGEVHGGVPQYGASTGCGVP